MEETYTHSLSQMLFCQKKYPQQGGKSLEILDSFNGIE
jgi:hypothetical protein